MDYKENNPDEMLFPLEAIQGYMEEKALSQTDFGYLIGSRSHASEVLNGKRKLSLSMIRRINADWEIPLKVLIQEY
jgi:HTH-type transcriptional regulator / antitoxin HigA